MMYKRSIDPFVVLATVAVTLLSTEATRAAGPSPINFALSDLTTGINAPTSIARGPDERLYVATLFGFLYILTLDDEYNVTETRVVETIHDLANDNILGIAFNPHDPSNPVQIYIAHGQHEATGGDCSDDFSPYSGQVTLLEGPDFDTVQPLITGLPVSNHDHSVNGMAFDNNGDLYICVGGNTNAGVPSCILGGLPESPLSGAILKAELSNPDFNGQIEYSPDDNQQSGGIAELLTGTNVAVYAPGFRNPYDIAFTTQQMIYCTDNGADANFGAASTGPGEQGPDPDSPDELNLVEFSQYHGHPNPNRAVADPRQWVYHDHIEPSIPGVFRQVLTTFPSSTDGIVEYRANTFGGAMRGDLLTQRFTGPGSTFRVTLSEDGRSVVDQGELPVSLGSLDIMTGPGGVILGCQFFGDKVVIARPSDEPSRGLVAYDIFPWRTRRMVPFPSSSEATVSGIASGT